MQSGRYDYSRTRPSCYICDHEGVWKITAGEIADYFYANYYQKP
jgi:hypothetical protein